MATNTEQSLRCRGQTLSKVAGGNSFEYLFDLAGRAVTELVAGTATTNRSEACAGSRHLVTQNSSMTYFIHADWLRHHRESEDGILRNPNIITFLVDIPMPRFYRPNHQ